MSTDDRDRIGRFFLRPHQKYGTYYICWYNPANRQTDGFSTRKADVEQARRALAEHALKFEQPTQGKDAQLAAVLHAYYTHYAQHLPSAHAQRAAQADALEIWHDVNVSQLDRKKQLELVETLRARPLSDWTIQGRLTRIWAAINWCKRDNAELVVPAPITAADWKPLLPNNERTYSLQELAALLNSASDQKTDRRYSREHWWRFLVLAVGTASREAALRELTWAQVDLRLGRIHLNPEGRRQTKKRRATVPIAPTLMAELSAWEHQGDHVITYYGEPLATREFFDLLAETAGVTGGPNVIRHTVRTWLAEYGVPDAEADVFMGHKSEGSATGKRYIHRRPEYLRSVVDGIEAMYDALSQLVTRPFKGHTRIDQPTPGDAVSTLLRGSCVEVKRTALRNLLNLERETRLELATPTLARSCSTN